MIYATTIVILLSQHLFAKTYGAASDDYGHAVIQSMDGGYAIAGWTNGFGASGWDILVLKINSIGGVEWAKIFRGSGDEYARSIAQTTDGGYLVAGPTNSFTGGWEFLVMKLNSTGSLQWAKTIGGTGTDYAFWVSRTSDGGCVVSGYTTSYGAGNNDCLIIKLNSTGGLEWAKTFGGPNSEYPYAVVQTQDGGYAVGAWTYSFGAGNWDILVLKLASDGSLIWAKTFGGTAEDYCRTLNATGDGGLLAGGMTRSFGAGDWDFLVLKLASDGSLSWARTFGGMGQEDLDFVCQTSDNGYFATGYTSSFGVGWDILVLKLASDGSLTWARRFGGNNIDYVYQGIPTSEGCYMVGGYTSSYGSGNGDVLALRLDHNGNYTDCVAECSPIVTSPSVTSNSYTMGANWNPTVRTPTLTVVTPTLTVTDACPPYTHTEETSTSNQMPLIACYPMSDAALFLSSIEIGIKIYAADGRVVYSGKLSRGENRISLEQGVYIWQAGTFKGKAIVR